MFSDGVQYVPKKMSLLSSSSFTLSQPWPNVLATTFFLLLYSAFPAPAYFLLPLFYWDQPCQQHGKGNKWLYLVFSSLCEMMERFGTILSVHQEGQVEVNYHYQECRTAATRFHGLSHLPSGNDLRLYISPQIIYCFSQGYKSGCLKRALL